MTEIEFGCLFEIYPNFYVLIPRLEIYSTLSFLILGRNTARKACLRVFLASTSAKAGSARVGKIHSLMSLGFKINVVQFDLKMTEDDLSTSVCSDVLGSYAALLNFAISLNFFVAWIFLFPNFHNHVCLIFILNTQYHVYAGVYALSFCIIFFHFLFYNNANRKCSPILPLPVTLHET